MVLAYVAAAAALMDYLATLEGDDEFGTSVAVAFLAAHVMVGFLLGRWRTLLLVLLLPLLAIPVPVPEDAYEPLPLWYAMIVFVGPAAAAAMAAGVAARKAIARVRQARAS